MLVDKGGFKRNYFQSYSFSSKKKENEGKFTDIKDYQPNHERILLLLITVVVFCDDILLFTEESYDINEVKKVLATLELANAIVKLRKMKMAKKKFDFLELSLPTAGWSISKSFIQIADYVKPAKNIKQLHGLMGLFN